MSTPQGSTCTPGSLVSFPVNLSVFTPTADLYTSVLDPLQFQFTWTRRNTAPTFKLANSSLLDEAPTNTLTYQGRTYSLESVQFTKPTHTNWIVPFSEQLKHKEDIILTYTYPEALVDTAQFIIIVVPILRATAATGDPVYLTAISNPTAAAGTEFDLSSVIPRRSGELFAYYTTCSRGYILNSPAQNTLVVVSVQGLYASNTTMANILAAYQRNSLQTEYGPYRTPVTLFFDSTPYSFPNETDFRMRVKTTKDLLTTPTPTNAASPTPSPVDQTIDAYKCVPLDPETQIRGGAIRVDPTTGTLLSQVEAERQAVITAEATPKAELTPAIFYKYVSTALSIFFAVTILGSLIYILFGTFIGATAVGPGATFFQKLFYRIQEVPGYVVIGVLMAFVGFLVGMVVRYS